MSELFANDKFSHTTLSAKRVFNHFIDNHLVSEHLYSIGRYLDGKRVWSKMEGTISRADCEPGEPWIIYLEASNYLRSEEHKIDTFYIEITWDKVVNSQIDSRRLAAGSKITVKGPVVKRDNDIVFQAHGDILIQKRRSANYNLRHKVTVHVMPENPDRVGSTDVGDIIIID